MAWKKRTLEFYGRYSRPKQLMYMTLACLVIWLMLITCTLIFRPANSAKWIAVCTVFVVILFSIRIGERILTKSEGLGNRAKN